MGFESYKPSDEEVKNATESLTPTQEEMSTHRERSYEKLKKVFEEQGLSIENIKNIDIKSTDRNDLNATYGVDNAREFKGEINGHEISIIYSARDGNVRSLKGKLDGIELSKAKASEILTKYMPVVSAIYSYDRDMFDFKEKLKTEIAQFDEEQKIGALLKDIL